MKPSIAKRSPWTPDGIQDPYDVYEELIREGPVVHEETGSVLLARHEDASQVLMNPHLFSSANVAGVGTMQTPEVEEIMATGPGFTPTLTPADPPMHARYRTVVNRIFSARSVLKLEARIREICNGLIDEFVDAGSVELVADFADPFPAMVFTELIGAEWDDVPRIRRWLTSFTDRQEGGLSKERELECVRDYVEMQWFLADFLRRRKEQPTDDVASVIANAEIESEDGDGKRPLTLAEQVSMLHIILQGGYHTTVMLITTSMWLLQHHPDELAACRQDSSRILAVVEEALRVESPIQRLYRTATQDAIVGGVDIPAGTHLAVLYGAANRDESVFGCPAEFTPGRKNIGEHLAFGRGEHYCLGASLARLEGKVAIETLLDRLPGLELAQDRQKDRWLDREHHRGLVELHLTFDRA